MTSNIGSEYILENKDSNLVLNELKKYFKPEFLNRIDEIIMFNSLSKDVVYNILENIIFEIEDRLKDKNLKLNLTHRAKEYIIENSYDPNYGARPIRRYVQANIETLIAKNIIEGNINFGQIINIDVKNEKLEII
jgi:ATP-dependent Clp protease ATP-binding subunit ClpB